MRMRWQIPLLVIALTACGPATGIVDGRDYFAPYLEVGLYDGARLFPGDRFEVFAEDFDSGIYRLRVALDGDLLVDYRYSAYRIDELVRVPYAPGWRIIYIEVLDYDFNRASRTYEVFIEP